MKVINIISISFILLLCSCNKVEPSKIEFQGHSFELPGKVYDVQKSLNLEYGFYTGFYKGNVNNPLISTQLENQPVFMGSDTDSEESYYSKNIVGITFHMDSKLFEKSKMNLIKQFGSNFVKKPMKSSWVTDEYWILQTDNQLSVVLIENLKYRDTMMSVSFYKGLEANEIDHYITKNSKRNVY